MQLLCLWSDAELCSNPEEPKSTVGMFLDLLNLVTGARWPMAWSVNRQGATAGSTAEVENGPFNSNAGAFRNR